ncbi:hypothetical protein ACIQXM_05935 [Arthrobacter sp. NPDC097144]
MESEFDGLEPVGGAGIRRRAGVVVPRRERVEPQPRNLIRSR